MSLQKYMPDLAALFSHVLVDVSSLKALCIRWYPRDNKKAPSKKNKHRAMDDIRESIMELKYYRDNIFKASKSRKWCKKGIAADGFLCGKVSISKCLRYL
jgi:oligoribonuclease